MSWLYGQTWLWYLPAFAVGVLPAWVVLVLPQQRRLRALEGGAPDRGPIEQERTAAAPAAHGGERPPVDDAVTEQIPAMNPALSTLDMFTTGPVAAATATTETPTPDAPTEPGTSEPAPDTPTGGTEAAVTPGRFPGSALPAPDGTAPTAAHTVKGNGGSMLYHTPESPYFGRTKAEVWFTSTADAEDAGFTGWRRRS